MKRHGNTSHGATTGGRKTKEFRTWTEIKTRCLNSRAVSFKQYGGRGVTVCARWLGPKGFQSFLADMGKCPTGKCSIDRIDNANGYSKNNCRWADWLEQANNRRNNTKITHNGVTKNLCQWADAIGVKRPALCQRIKYGWPIERVLTP